MNFEKIEKLIKQSQNPLPSKVLESLQTILEGHKDNYYRFLYLLVKEIQPAVCLEIGVSKGTASVHMCEAAKEYGGIVIGIDIKYHPFPGEFLPRKYDYFFLHGKSTDLKIVDQIKKLITEYGSIGIVYQDSSHHYLETVEEWNIYSQLLDLNSVWICDDITPAFYNTDVDPLGKGMVQYFEELPGDKRLYDDLHYGSKQGIILL